jgi:hypothetical protein
VTTLRTDAKTRILLDGVKEVGGRKHQRPTLPGSKRVAPIYLEPTGMPC